ncbi:MAG: glycosyltransferase family 2 protein [Candidatus Levybacteria bacterium]|nr:glycosyltransferase family 2 protein [Candidatus Levybacteria bacterium]
MLSAVVLTKNEEVNIVDCLESLDFCDEIIIIDDFSEDRTIQLAERYRVKIFKRRLENDFSSQRNFALEKANGDFVLFLDADERISSILRKEIIYKIDARKDTNGFLFKREDFLFGKYLKHGETASVRLLRLAKKNGARWEGIVHEKMLVEGKTEELENPILHFPHKSITEFLKEINLYTTLKANELFKEEKKVKFITIILYPKAKFLLNFFIRRGFLDGIEGFIFAIFMSFHSFLVRAKLWMLWQKNF